MFTAGNFSSISITFKLAREMGFFMMDYYIPSILIVVISWVSFWLHMDASPPRIVLGDKFKKYNLFNTNLLYYRIKN